MYFIVALISFIIRQYYLPDPFEPFGVWAFWINAAAEPIIHFITFGLVGTVYDSGDCPPLGSALYLGARIIITAALYGASTLIVNSFF